MSLSLLTLLIWILKPVNGLISFVEFIAFITHTPDLIDYETSSPVYWILSLLLGLYGVSIMVWAVCVASADNYRQSFFPYAFAYPPIRLIVLAILYFKLRQSGNLFLVWYDLAATIVVFTILGLVAIRGYAYQEKPQKKTIINEEEIIGN